MLVVYAAFKIPKTVPQLQTFDIMHSGALEQKQCEMVQRAEMLTELTVLFFHCSRAKAKSLCTILTEPILTLKSGMKYLFSF
jgi:hypothetical protein